MLQSTASLMKDLHSKDYNWVLTARVQTDPLELRFSKYHQMSDYNFWSVYEQYRKNIWTNFNHKKSSQRVHFSIEKMFVQIKPKPLQIVLHYFKKQIHKIVGKLEYCSSENTAKKVPKLLLLQDKLLKKLLNTFYRVECQNSLTTTGPQQSSSEWLPVPFEIIPSRSYFSFGGLGKLCVEIFCKTRHS